LILGEIAVKAHYLLAAAVLVLAAPAAAEDPVTPAVSSPALAAAAPDLAAVPGLLLVGYEVRGRSPMAIRESLNEGRPADNGQRFDGRTTFEYQTSWERDSNGRCDPAAVQVTATFVVTLPELKSRGVLDRDQRLAWDRYFSALIAHEHNHVRIAQGGLEQLRTYLRSAPSCEAMEAARQQIQTAMTEAQRAYDERTGHGRSEGARYP
jgi:predicted secreted Zn-dependent protease